MADHKKQRDDTLQYVWQNGTASCTDTIIIKQTKTKRFKKGCRKLLRSFFPCVQQRNPSSDHTQNDPGFAIQPARNFSQESDNSHLPPCEFYVLVRNSYKNPGDCVFECPPIPPKVTEQTVVNNGRLQRGSARLYQVSKAVPLKDNLFMNENDVYRGVGLLDSFKSLSVAASTLHGDYSDPFHMTAVKDISDADQTEEHQAQTENSIGVQTIGNEDLHDTTDSPLAREVKSAVSRAASDVDDQTLLDNQQDLYHSLHPSHLQCKTQQKLDWMFKGAFVFPGNDYRKYRLPEQIYYDYCYPRFCEEHTRFDSLKDCSDRQRKGYESKELARVGWYFNGRTLVTFCCGMEMPQTPRGEPLDVHRGLSPHCSFALSLQSSAAFACEGEMQRVAERMKSLEAGGAAAELSYGVQATDDPFGTYGQASDAFEDGQHDLFVGYQETRPGEQWLGGLDYALNFSAPIEDSSYRESLVTNRTPTAAETWQPHTGVSDVPDGDLRPAEFQQNSFTSAGRVYVRAPGSVNSQGTARLIRQLANDPARQSPPPFNLEEQIEMMGGPLGDGDRPRHPQFAFPSVRIWTYEGWPRDHSQRPPVLADAGFFYAGYGDCVLCYSCGIGLRHWTPMDNAWIEHARWKPSCHYVRSIQGEEFIQVAREFTRNNRHPTYEEVRLEANLRKQANEQGAEQEAPPAVHEDGERDRNILCKVCYTNEMCIVLMPCRHLAVCEGCSGRVFACPICRSRVESTFRASFG